MPDFISMLSYLENMGFFDIFLPFVLTFTITYAVLARSKILGDKRNYNLIVAFVLAILVARSKYVTGIINRLLPNIAILMIIILMFLLLLGLFAGKKVEIKNWAYGIAVLLSLGLIIWALAADYIGENLNIPEWLYYIDDQTKAILVFAGALVLVIIFFMLSGKEREKQEQEKKMTKGLGKFLENLGEGFR